ncbi:hypothetical protein BD310DRAFT_573371 [Dichomitus squalens]|uniref:Uncharacterized protein n=1 Tax=Dichomitus squalens TaxID=114155 RepID=A0A4V2K7Q7_9APHY|nr:hypothetical protein BD310DRAFT_573371 [Dichomitus squalens]
MSHPIIDYRLVVRALACSDVRASRLARGHDRAELRADSYTLATACLHCSFVICKTCSCPTMLAPRAMHAYAELRMSNAPSLTASNHACMHQWSTPHTWPSHSQSRRSFLPALPVRSMPVHHEAAYTDYRYADQSDRVEEDWTKREKTSSARQGIISSSTSPAQTAGGSPRDLPSRLSAQLVESDTHVHCFRDRTQRLGYASRAPRRGKGGLVFTLW